MTPPVMPMTPVGPADGPEIVAHDTCRLCATALEVVLDLGSQYISEFPTAPSQASHPPVPLALMLCPKCGLVQLRHTVPREWLYSQYWYRSGVNESMVTALRDVVNRATELVDLKPWDWVMDIGANDGTLLSCYHTELRKAASKAPQRIAFDPAVNLQGELRHHCEVLIPDFFPSAAYSGPKPKVITSIAMFYDLEDPRAFVKEVKRILHRDGVWILQLGSLDALVTHNAFDAICHEHLEYYSLATLVVLLEEEGLQAFDAEENQVNGGSIRVYVKHAEAHPLPGNRVIEIVAREAHLGLMEEETYLNLQQKIDRYGAQVRDMISAAGVVDVLGASTKGNTLLQTWGIAHPMIRRAIERSPEKVGRYTVGTNIPIVDEEEGRRDQAALVLVLPWHFRESILQREKNRWKPGTRFLFPLPEPQVVTL